MKRHSPQEQKLITEARDLLHSWALADSSERDAHCLAVAAFLQRLGDELSQDRVLPLFIGSAAFAAVVSLAREGKHTEAQTLISDLGYAARLGECDEAVTLLRDLRADLTRYNEGNPEADEATVLASALACFGGGRVATK